MKTNVYDFDGTIYDGDSSTDFIKLLIKKNKKLILYLPKMLFSFIGYKIKIINKERMKESFFSVLKEFDNIDKIVIEFWNINDYKIKDFFRNKKHTCDIIASASPYFLLEPITKKYKVKDLFASPIDKKTGKYNGINCHGKEKVRLLKGKYKDIIIETMYTDNIKADRPLLELAKKSYVVIDNELIEYKEYLKINKNLFKKLLNTYHKYEEIVNYLIVGGLTTAVSLGIYYGLVLTILNPKNPIELQIANIVSWIGAVIFAYITNRKFVFKSNNKNIKKEAVSFIGSRVLTLLLDMFSMFLLVTVLHINDKIGKIIAQFLVLVGNYLISKLVVFRKK